jgi:uncharacterized Fe-S center protein
MASNVHFYEFGKWGGALEGIDLLLGATVPKKTYKTRRVAIKIHFGEMGNYTHMRPAFVRRVADFVKAEGGKPFMTETTTLYPSGKRLTVEECLETAKYNGFTEDGLGCPIVIADEPDGQNGIEFTVDDAAEYCRIKSTIVARHLLEADAIIVLSHVKGHSLSGMGGALKNLSMGCTTRKAKREQHASHGLVFDYEKCSGCGKCVEACRFEALVLEDEKPVKDEEGCMYCNTCLYTCESKAISILPNGKELFQRAIAHAAAGVMKGFSGKSVIFINAIMDVTPICDCCAPAGRLVTQNVGLLGSTDPVAIDMASLRLVDSAPMIPGWDISPPDVLGKINRTESTIHMKEAARLGIGSLGCELVRV